MPHHGVQFGPQGRLTGLDAVEFPGKGGIILTEQLPGQGVFAGIMPVEGAFGDPGRGGDVPDGGAVDALVHKEAQRRAGDQFFRLIFGSHLFIRALIS